MGTLKGNTNGFKKGHIPWIKGKHPKGHPIFVFIMKIKMIKLLKKLFMKKRIIEKVNGICRRHYFGGEIKDCPDCGCSVIFTIKND